MELTFTNRSKAYPISRDRRKDGKEERFVFGFEGTIRIRDLI